MPDIYLETASVLQYKMASRTFRLDGILTTPANIAATKQMPATLIDELDDILESNQKLFVQLLKTDYTSMLSEAVQLANANDDLILQVPAIKDGFQLLLQSEKLDLHLCMAGCFTAMQALMAARNGAEYVEFYLNQMLDLSISLEEIGAFMQMKKLYSLETKVLVSSFRNEVQVQKVLQLGVDAIALPLQLLMQPASFPQNRIVQGQFAAAWQQAYNRDGFYATMEDEAAKEELNSINQQTG